MSEVENAEVAVANEQKDYVEDGKNKLVVKCKFCGSKILDKKSAKYIILEVLYFHFGPLFYFHSNKFSLSIILLQKQ